MSSVRTVDRDKANRMSRPRPRRPACERRLGPSDLTGRLCPSCWAARPQAIALALQSLHSPGRQPICGGDLSTPSPITSSETTTAADAARSAKNGEWGTVAELRSCDDSHCASLADKDSDALLKRLNKLLY
jgi:hypothetical protein